MAVTKTSTFEPPLDGVEVVYLVRRGEDVFAKLWAYGDAWGQLNNEEVPLTGLDGAWCLKSEVKGRRFAPAV